MIFAYFEKYVVKNGKAGQIGENMQQHIGLILFGIL